MLDCFYHQTQAGDLESGSIKLQGHHLPYIVEICPRSPGFPQLGIVIGALKCALQPPTSSPEPANHTLHCATQKLLMILPKGAVLASLLSSERGIANVVNEILARSCQKSSKNLRIRQVETGQKVTAGMVAAAKSFSPDARLHTQNLCWFNIMANRPGSRHAAYRRRGGEQT